jgi:pimeloyl-ACP methyl ester carboxylesterase
MGKNWQEEEISVDGVALSLRAGGSGSPLLVLPGIDDGSEWLPCHRALANHFRVLLPALPGFGRSELPAWLDSVDDLAYLVLDLVERLGLGPVDLLGLGFGGWVAAEMAVRCRHEVRRLVLADAFGIKVSEPWVRDIADIFVLTHEQLAPLAWHDPAAAKDVKVPGAPGLSEDDLVESLRRRQTVHMLGWRPFLHNPKLLRRLGRIRVPTLVIWGESDRIVSSEYGRAYHQAIPGSRFKTIQRAGHYPYREQPEEFARAVTEFLL